MRQAGPVSSSHFRYQQVHLKAPLELVEEALRLYRAVSAVEEYGEQTWQLFELAHKYRSLAVHECIYLEQGKYQARQSGGPDQPSLRLRRSLP